MSSYPKDRFDDLPADLDRRGAHRAPRTRAAKIASWLWGLAAVAALVLLGVLGMSIIDRIVTPGEQADATAEATATGAPPVEETQAAVTPKLDPNVAVTVLNGTGGSGVATRGMETLSAAGWNVVNTGDADSYTNPTTVIAYGDAAQEAAALQIAEDLGGGTPTLDPAQEAGAITVTIGTDVAG